MDRILGIYKSFWVNGADYRSKTTRNDFWMALWWNVIVYLLIMAYIMAYKRRTGAIFGIFVFVVYTIASILPLITLMMRRYNDLGLSKYWLVITLVLPVVLLIIGGLACDVIAGVLIVVSLIIFMLPHDEFNR